MKNKDALIVQIQQNLLNNAGFSATKEDVQKIYVAVCDAIYARIVAGDDVYIKNVGHTTRSVMKERECNLCTGGTAIVPRHETLRFRFSQELRDIVKNQSRDQDGC